MMGAEVRGERMTRRKGERRWGRGKVDRSGGQGKGEEREIQCSTN